MITRDNYKEFFNQLDYASIVLFLNQILEERADEMGLISPKYTLEYTTNGSDHKFKLANMNSDPLWEDYQSVHSYYKWYEWMQIFDEDQEIHVDDVEAMLVDYLMQIYNEIVTYELQASPDLRVNNPMFAHETVALFEDEDSDRWEKFVSDQDDDQDSEQDDDQDGLSYWEFNISSETIELAESMHQAGYTVIVGETIRIFERGTPATLDML